MTFSPFPPAMVEISSDREIIRNPMSFLMYVRISTSGECNFKKPEHVKISQHSEQTGLHRDTISKALDLLVARGYITEGGREENNLRTFQLNWTREERSSAA